MSPAGVTFLDHTADVGMDVDADSLHQLLHRCALGMLALLRGEEEEDGPGSPDTADSRDVGDDPDGGDRGVAIDVRAEEVVGLVAGWLRELLFLHEVRGMDYAGLEVDHLDGRRLTGRLVTRADGRAVREIKGVTYHELAVTEEGGRWRARVIFDV